nr:IS66 family insertion sequence element accessory protein TnpB [Methylovulum psychrotolerans]
MRKGADGLSAIVQQALGHKPCAGSAFVFRNRAGNRLKLLLWGGGGRIQAQLQGNALVVCRRAVNGQGIEPLAELRRFRFRQPSADIAFHISVQAVQVDAQPGQFGFDHAFEQVLQLADVDLVALLVVSRRLGDREA